MKSQIRKRILAHRESMSWEIAEKKSKEIQARLKKDQDYKNAKVVMFYISKGREVHTHDMIKEAVKSKKVIVPKVDKESIICCQFDSFDNLEKSCYDVPEPKNLIKCNIQDIDLIIVPGVAFDGNKHRIGYGKGYYDLLLKDMKCKKIGLAYDSQIVEPILVDKWDIQLDKIITESKTI